MKRGQIKTMNKGTVWCRTKISFGLFLQIAHLLEQKRSFVRIRFDWPEFRIVGVYLPV